MLQVKIEYGGNIVLNESMVAMRDIWEETSFQLEKLQANPECVQEESDGMKLRKAPPYRVNFSTVDRILTEQVDPPAGKHCHFA